MVIPGAATVPATPRTKFVSAGESSESYATGASGILFDRARDETNEVSLSLIHGRGAGVGVEVGVGVRLYYL